MHPRVSGLSFTSKRSPEGLRLVVPLTHPTSSRMNAKAELGDDSTKQVYQHIQSHVELGETAKGIDKPAVLLSTAGALAGSRHGHRNCHRQKYRRYYPVKGAAVGVNVGAIYGGTKRYNELESQIRQGLLQQSLRNERIRPGELAYGYLFFPEKKRLKLPMHSALASA